MLRPTRFVLGGFAVGLGVGSAGAYFYFTKLQPKRRLTREEEGRVVESHPALKYGAPQSADVVRHMQNFVASFDARTRNSRWVLERINRSTVEGEADRQYEVFYEDKELEEAFRNKLSHFKGTGYDRGHLAPATDHKGSQGAMGETFNLVNISPQVGKGFNRDYWARLEKFIRDLTRTCADVYVVTGPLWVPQGTRRTEGGGVLTEFSYEGIGMPPSVVAVPTHFYKVILAEPKDTPGKLAVAAFAMPNSPIDPDVPLTYWSIPLDMIEQLAGLRFFPDHLDAGRRGAITQASLAWHKVGREIASYKPPGRTDLPALPETSSPLVPALPAPKARDDTPVLSKARRRELLQAKKTSGNSGAVHVCDMQLCDLPPPGWYLKKGGERLEPHSPHRMHSPGGRR